VAVGGRTTSTVQDFNANYGLVDVPKTPNATTEKRGKNKDIESAQGHGRSNCSHLLVFRRVA
jgi:hypothetical protein